MGNLRINKVAGVGISVRFPARTWEKAHAIIESLREEPPSGYKLRGSQVTPKCKSGKRCNLKLTFEYVDDREPVFTIVEAQAWFAPFAKEAASGG